MSTRVPDFSRDLPAPTLLDHVGPVVQVSVSPSSPRSRCDTEAPLDLSRWSRGRASNCACAEAARSEKGRGPRVAPMNNEDLATVLADPIQVLGMSFYFDELTKVRGKEHGINVVEFYGLGRAGVLGDVETTTVVDAFTFFDPSLIDYFWTSAKTKADPVTTAGAHLDAAYEFADRTFGAVDAGLLAIFSDAARQVIDAQPLGVCLLVDGYRQFATPSDPVHAAYLGTILLR